MNKKNMSETPKFSKERCDSIKVGTTGTIGSLMSQELESSKDSLQASSSSSQKKSMTSPVSLSCVYAPKRTHQRKDSSSEASNSNNCNADHGSLSNSQKPKQKPKKNGRQAPILSNEATLDKNTTRNKPNKKGHTYIAEVVDIKCNNPMSSRLKKLGFSKLSESIG